MLVCTCSMAQGVEYPIHIRYIDTRNTYPMAMRIRIGFLLELRVSVPFFYTFIQNQGQSIYNRPLCVQNRLQNQPILMKENCYRR